MSVEEILKKHGVYTQDLEIDLLCHFIYLRNEVFTRCQNTEQDHIVDTNKKEEVCQK